MIVERRMFPEVERRTRAELQADLLTLATDQDFVINRITPDVEDSFRIQAVLAYLHDGDIAGFHRNMFLAAKVREWFVGCLRAGLKAPPGLVAISYDRGIWEALCSGEPDVVLALARAKPIASTDLRANGVYLFFALAIRLLILGAPEDALEMADDFDGKRKGRHPGQAKLLRGLIQPDADLFNAGLAEALALRQKQIDEDIDVYLGEQWLWVDGVALARLAQSRGLALTVDHPLIPRELLGKPPDSYPDARAILPPVPNQIIEVPEEPLPTEEELKTEADE